MKIKLLTILVCTFLLNGVKAQQLQHCKTHEKMLELQKANPATEARMWSAEQKIQDWISANKNYKSTAVLTIPVVVHVLYENSIQNIPDARIQLQIDILNKDYRKLNSDTASIPAAFKPLAADCELQFCLAQRDPFGNATNGITRRSVTINEIGNTNNYYNSVSGGQDIWDRNFYLNIWVCEIESNGATLGYSTVPSFTPPAASDGVVIDYRYFGTSTNTHYNKGRTATHEIGHWFNMQHIWGDDGGSCLGDDFVGDTPNQWSEHYGLPSFPSLDSCAPALPGTMYMNYMDYTDDDGMNMFTQGQKQRIWAALMTTVRDSLFNSKGCQPIGIDELQSDNAVKVSPNPSEGKITVAISTSTNEHTELLIYDVLGNIILKQAVEEEQRHAISIDLSSFSNGLYVLKINSGANFYTQKIIKE